MKFISRKFHAVLDYLSAVILIAAPWLLNFSHLTNATYVAIFAGVLVFGLSMMTKYEGGLIRIVPMKLHLATDVLLGIFLIVSPWLLDFNTAVYIPFLVMGLLAIFSGLLTNTSSLDKQ